MRQQKRHIALDFDGTLAHYDKWKGVGVYGPPIEFMVNKVKELLKDGHEVTIFTARGGNPADIEAIQKWLVAAGLPALNVTNTKYFFFTEFWDDRALHIVKNTGMTEDEDAWYSMHPEELEYRFKD